MVRVRIAPSPTGIPHIGNTRTALFNYLFARHNNGKFIVRIEDTDRARLVPGAEKAIYEILTWLGLDWDEQYKQSERLDIYSQYASELQKKGLTYKDGEAVRFKMPKTGETSWVDLIGEKHILFKNNTQEDFVILKSDGFPTYNFANVVDDHVMKISHVIRGDEFISSTPKHLQLYNAFGWKSPFFVHLPVVLGPDRAKLSKRHGAESVLYYREQGYLKEALLNFMALLGWSPKRDKEILSIDEMIKLFDLKDVNTNSPIFNIDKLLWFNGCYIRTLSIDQLVSSIKNQVSGMKDKDDGLIKKIIPLAQTRMKTLNEFKELVSHFFEEPEIRLNEREKSIGEKLIERFLAIQQWSNEKILKELKLVMDTKHIAMPVIYKILIGKDRGLPLPESLVILGKEKVLERLKKATL